MPLAAHEGNHAGIFGATEYRSLAEWERLKPESDAEAESWFSLKQSFVNPQSEKPLEF
jgi:hypothetical protein